MFESLFEFLFEYRPVIFSQGEFRLSPPSGAYAAGAIALAVIAVALIAYRAVRSSARLRDRAVLVLLRLSVLSILLLALFRPVLVVKAAVSQQNFLAVLVDDSRSMQIGDWGARPRADFVRQEFGRAEAPLLNALSERFVLRPFRFSTGASRLGSPADLTFEGGQTRLGAALDNARQEMAGLPLAGIVLVSDGADTSDAALSDALLALKSS